MKIEPENPQDIADIIAAEFRTFGGGRVVMGNPISHALKDTPASFGAGVSVKDVVDRVIALSFYLRSN